MANHTILFLLMVGIVKLNALPQFGGFANFRDSSIPSRNRLFGPIAEVPSVVASQTIGTGVRVMNTGLDTVGDVVQFGIGNTFRVTDGVSHMIVGTMETARDIVGDKGHYINNRVAHAGDSTNKVVHSGVDLFSETLDAGTEFVGRVAEAGFKTLVVIGDAAGGFVVGTVDDTMNLIGGTAERIGRQTMDSVSRITG